MPQFSDTRLVVDMRELEEFAEKLSSGMLEKAYIEAAYQIAGEWLARVQDLSPRDTGTLADSWHLTDLRVEGNVVEIELYNSAVADDGAPYPLYVELGHRQEAGRFVPALGKRLVRDWVPGRFMLRTSRDDMERRAAKIVEQKMKEAWERMG